MFEKKEDIEGATSENTYIDSNGDIYRVSESGLYKNDTLIFAKEGEALEQIGVDLPPNLVCFYNDEVYITKEESNTDNPFGYYVFHCGDYEEIYKPWEVSGTAISYYISECSFDIEHIYDERLGDIYCVATQVRSLLKMYIYTKDAEGNVVNSFFTFYSGYGGSLPARVNAQTLSKVCIFPVESPSVIISFFVGGWYTHKACILYSFNTQQWSSVRPFANDDAKYEYTFYKKNYYGKIICQKSNFSDNYALAEVTRIYYRVSERPINMDMTGLNETRLVSGNTITEDYNTFKTKYGGVSVFKRDVDGSYTFTGVCDAGNVGMISKYDDNKAVVNIGCVIGGIYLMNNSLVSGLSLGSSVLLTEWNSVDSDGNFVFYFYDRQELYYKNILNNKWYKIFIGSPKLWIKYNQLVTNFNQIRNAYSLTKQKIVMFASAFNNRLVSPSTSSSQGNFYPIQDNDTYYACCINEYYLEDNSSIILNPIPIMRHLNNPSYTVLKESGDICVNHYYNIYPDTEIKYRYSKTNPKNFFISNAQTENGYVFRNENLLDLSFPSDTNGNVAYTPSLFAEFFSSFGNEVFVKEGSDSYQLSKYNNQLIMSFYLGTLIEGFSNIFILQGQYYGVINNQVFALQFANGVVSSMISIVSIYGLQFVGNTPYEALFFSKTNRCLYSFTGANVLSQKQLVDKISEVRDYLYNPATQTVFLITDIGVLFYGIFGQFLLEYTDVSKIFLLQNGIVMSNNSGNYRYIKYYLDEGDTDFEKHNINLETCFYGMNNQTVTINDCLYFRLFSEEHEEGSLKVSATTISLRGRKTEETTFKIRASDWDKITHTIYLRYQPKEQRGLGISFSINSPFKIASLSVGSQADAILVDKVSKGAINAPQRTSNNVEW